MMPDTVLGLANGGKKVEVYRSNRIRIFLCRKQILFSLLVCKWFFVEILINLQKQDQVIENFY